MLHFSYVATLHLAECNSLPCNLTACSANAPQENGHLQSCDCVQGREGIKEEILLLQWHSKPRKSSLLSEKQNQLLLFFSIDLTQVV